MKITSLTEEKREGAIAVMGGFKEELQEIEAEGESRVAEEEPSHIQAGIQSTPPKLKSLLDPLSKWDDKGSVIENYESFDVVSNPNFLGVRSRTAHIVENDSLQMPPSGNNVVSEFEAIDSGSDVEEDDLKSALGKTRTDGKSGSLQLLTAIQRLHVGQLVEKYGDDYQSMFMDAKSNKMQHSVATLEKICKRYHTFKDKNPLIGGS